MSANAVPQRSLRRVAAIEGANLQEDNPDPAEVSDKPSVTSSLSEAEQITGSWWSAKVNYHPQAYLGMQLGMAAECWPIFFFSKTCHRNFAIFHALPAMLCVHTRIHHVPQAALAAV